MHYFLLLCGMAAFGAAVVLFLSHAIPVAILAAIGGLILIGQAYLVAAIKDVLARPSSR
jgi:hypothetical protein